MKRSDMVIIGAALLVAALFKPWAGLLVVAVAFIAGFVAVFALKRLVDDNNPGGAELSVQITLLVIESLMSGNGDERQGGRLPVVSSASSGKGSDWMRNLYKMEAFKRCCNAIALLGPVPCYPAYNVLARMA